ncbi:hypothetical protein ES703_38231 [subsurface metagenome]
MIKGESQVSRKTVNENRIAICPQFGCKHLEKVKPLKFGVLGFRKYPKCSKHKSPLVFVDEFIGGFLYAVNACLFDMSSLPPENLRSLIKKKVPNELTTFINGWMYCNPIGRGAQIVSQYMDGISRGYMKLLSKKQRKALKNEKSSKKRYNMLRYGLKKIAIEYTTFLKDLREKSEFFCDQENLSPLSNKVQFILKTWLKDHLSTIKGVNGLKQSEPTLQDEFLQVVKENYDKILHAGTCALLLGKSPSIVTKTIPAFELFSAYHEFLKAGLCTELIGENVKLLLEESKEFLNVSRENILNAQEDEEEDFFNESGKKKYENSECEKIEDIVVNITNINMLNFRKQIRNHLKTLHKSINGTQKQKEIIRSKSLEILDEHISRAIKNEFTIPKNANLKVIATTIIYAVIISNENIPKINITQISGIQHDRITQYYSRYFKDLYPRKNFHFASYKGFNDIRNNIALYFFRLIKDSQVKTSELVIHLRNKVLKNINLPKELTTENIDILLEMATQYKDPFINYFSDLAEVVKQLTISSIAHKEINAHLIIKDLAKFLEEKGINLLQTSKTFYHSIIDIFDFLRKEYSDFFPIRSRTQISLPKKGSMRRHNIYRKIIGFKLKLYVIKNIYNGKYCKNGKCKCPECQKEGFIVNTDITRLKALEFHHSTDEKENLFSSANLYYLFAKDRSNPNFLRDLIKLMEIEKVILVCRNHHRSLYHFEYYNHFNYLINWKDLFSIPAELVHIIIRTSVANHYLTKDLSTEVKGDIRRCIKRYIKKRYILENFYDKFCPTCEEFNIKEYHSVFSFHHLDDNTKKILASDIYDLPCSEILRILEQEKGGYICANCHTVMHYKHIHLLDKIYNDEEIVKRVLDDFNKVNKKFAIIIRKKAIRDPLKKDIIIDESIKRYLNAIYEISLSENEVTSTALMNYMGLTRTRPIHIFFRRKNDILKHYVNVKIGRGRHPTKFILTKEGREAVKLIHHFRDYYSSL